MKTSFSRSFFMAATTLLLALTILGASFQIQVNNYMEDSTVDGLRQDASVIANLAAAYSVDGNLSSRELLLNLDIISQVTEADVVICDSQGYIILCSDALTGCDHQGWQLNADYLNKVIENGGDSATGVIKSLYDDQRYVVSVPIISDSEAKGIVIVSSPTAATSQILNRISNIFLTAEVFVVLISVLAVTAFARRESRPLRDMAKAATAFGHGNLEARVKIEEDCSEEMEELALAFNNMASSLQKSEYQRQEFVANVSHELKTPMTTISGYIDGILDGTIPEERREHYLRIVSDETKRLSRLVRSMLDISQLQKEEGIPEEKKMHFDLEECAGQVLITFEKKINDKRLNVEVDMPEHPVYTMANRDYITQVIYNLIDNAVKFCPEGRTLGLKIREGNTKAYVSISNDGDTIPPEELPLVFDRFHKLDKSRSQNRDSWGLGLYIVKTIVCSHGEDISVSSKDGKTEFTFTMPLVN
ncbi:MAG: HAMP domain-containing sensor histidine kinase [Oscillospiraceae bacterium]|nr:HAMP domain-containing sensor histidine kinase [Oscillospiraceae bacterium]